VEALLAVVVGTLGWLGIRRFQSLRRTRRATRAAAILAAWSGAVAQRYQLPSDVASGSTVHGHGMDWPIVIEDSVMPADFMPSDSDPLPDLWRLWDDVQRQPLDQALARLRERGSANGWDSRGAQLATVLLHAAALDERPPGTVAEWLRRRDFNPAVAILRQSGALASGVELLLRTPPQERAVMWSAAASQVGATTR
jgi:hypothetical protein